jgi:hypothetical protein
MSNRLLTRAEFAAMVAPTARVPLRCPLLPAESHCWHEPHGLWPGNFPPPLVCCWCACTTDDPDAVPRRHGPHAPEE